MAIGFIFYGMCNQKAIVPNRKVSLTSYPFSQTLYCQVSIPHNRNTSQRYKKRRKTGIPTALGTLLAPEKSIDQSLHSKISWSANPDKPAASLIISIRRRVIGTCNFLPRIISDYHTAADGIWKRYITKNFRCMQKPTYCRRFLLAVRSTQTIRAEANFAICRMSITAIITF